jgi:2-oxo-3-hexenedioate decarboxylase
MDATTLAAELIELHEGARTAAPFSERDPALTPQTGYAASRLLHAHRVAQGWRPVGRKIGFTNRTIWPRYGVHEPIWGYIYDRTFVAAEGHRATIPLAGLVQPRIEPEICFKLKSRPPVTRDPAALLACIEWVAHSVEIVQSHYPDWKLKLADCTASNGLHGRLTHGTPVPVDKIAGLAAALPFLRIDLYKGGQKIDSGVGSNVLGSPLLALSFLIELLEKQEAFPKLQAGEIISTGTITDAHPVAPGETWRTDLHGFATRNLEIQFT